MAMTMLRSIYLINPASDFPTYFSAECFAGARLRPTTLMADLAVPTLAALVPAGIDVRLCDENVEPVDLDTPADVVGITGKVTQGGRMIAIARELRRRGKIVIIGGPYASLSPETLRPHCDILVRGEAEEIMGELFADLAAGRWKEEYVGTRPDLSSCPIPRWDLYPNDRALMGTVQTSRGCPFECEFCDVIQYLGRKQRHKPVDRVLLELEALYRHGYRSVFIADDNFTVYRKRTREILLALRDWNDRQTNGKVEFATQVSIDVARDDEILRMCAEAGVTNVFVGIETPNEDSLRETKKRQNLGVDLGDQVRTILDHGIWVTGGMIVGFDADDAGIFERQRQFAMRCPIPIFSVGALVAPESTPLHERMAREGRLVSGGSEVAAMPWSTNIVPRQMTREEMLRGVRWLCNELYHPAAFGERVLRFVDALGERRDPRSRQGKPAGAPRAVDIDGVELLARLPRMGPGEASMWGAVRAALSKKPQAAEFVTRMMMQYLQIRHMYDAGGIYEPHVEPLAPARPLTPLIQLSR
jgi:radical SAM superfamily enzyme YgiQ (UPF0313 family)